MISHVPDLTLSKLGQIDQYKMQWHYCNLLVNVRIDEVVTCLHNAVDLKQSIK